MCKTTTPPHAAGQDAIRKFPPNTNAGAVIPLQKYLQKYVTAFAAELIPATPPHLPPDIDPNAYKRVAFSLWPLRANAVSPYYAGIFDDDTDFSASLLKAAALFAAGQLLAEARAAAPNYTTRKLFLDGFNSSLQTGIKATADQRILSKGVGLAPQVTAILNVTGFGSSGGPTVTLTSTFQTSLSKMIVDSSDPAAAVCIDALGYGYISTALKQENFFDSDTSIGIWLAGDYANSSTYVRIPTVNDHPDAQNTTTRQMCRLFAMIRLHQLPPSDLYANSLMQNLLNEPKTGPDHTDPWLTPDRHPGVAPLFSIVQDKIGYAGLGTAQTPNVYSEGLVINWNDTSQRDSFNKKIDPTNANPGIRLSGEIAVCWQNLLAELIPGGNTVTPMFDPIIDLINNSVSDFLDQASL
jgi:hypothetical protein